MGCAVHPNFSEVPSRSFRIADIRETGSVIGHKGVFCVLTYSLQSSSDLSSQ